MKAVRRLLVVLLKDVHLALCRDLAGATKRLDFTISLVLGIETGRRGNVVGFLDIFEVQP